MSKPNKNEVPYHQLPPESEAKITLCDGKAVRFKDGRQIEAWRTEGFPGLYFRISGVPIDGKHSMLKFRLSEDAAQALAWLIVDKLTLDKGRKMEVMCDVKQWVKKGKA